MRLPVTILLMVAALLVLGAKCGNYDSEAPAPLFAQVTERTDRLIQIVSQDEIWVWRPGITGATLGSGACVNLAGRPWPGMYFSCMGQGNCSPNVGYLEDYKECKAVPDGSWRLKRIQ